MSHGAVLDLGRTLVYAVCDGLVCDCHHIIAHVNRSDVLIFYFFFPQCFKFVLFSFTGIYKHQWNTDYPRYLGCMLFAREPD